MKRKVLALLLQKFVVLLGISAVVWMLWEPHLEGRNVHATLFEIYFKDAFLAYAYAGSIAFFAGLYQAHRFLAYVQRGEAGSPGSLRALRAVRYCAFILIGFLVGAELYFVTLRRAQEDIAGGVMTGLFLMVASGVVVVVTRGLERKLGGAQI